MLDSQEIFLAAILGSVFVGILIAIIVIAAYMYYRKSRQSLLEKYQLENALLLSQVEIQEQAFKTISREIHDNIGQALTLAKLHLNTINLTNIEQSENKINESRTIVSQSIVALRDLSRTLHSDTVTNLGFVQAVLIEVERVNKIGTVVITVQCEAGIREPSSQTGVIILRIIQEAIQNVLKHSKASEVSMSMSSTLDEFIVVISDNGVGISITELNSNAGSGHRNMRDRAKIINAQLTINNGAQGGLTLTLKTPIHEHN